ncbi:MAG: hypothetical protein L0271_01865 [Gemmatimonadetes bacterium]|nr:hypothetical protein [Gemmatimonadota bacterium]
MNTAPAGFRPSVAALSVAVAALAVYAGALANGFAYDDVAVITQDARITALDPGAIFTRGYWQDAELSLYRPLTTLSFAIDWSLAPGSAAWFHLTNLVLHAGASVLAFLLLARLFAIPAAWAGAMVFALHPVHVEAVANVVGRADIIATIFAFGACLLWLERSRDPATAEAANAETGAGRPAGSAGGQGLRVTAVAGCVFLAMLSKESAAMIPALLVLVDAATGTLRPHALSAWLRTRGPALAILGIVVAAAVLARVAVLDGFAPGRVDPVLEIADTPFARVLTALQAWPVWVGLLFVPDVLLADYGPRVLGPALSLTLESVTGLLIAAGLCAGGVAAWARGHGRAALALLWLPLTILPVSNLLVPIGVLVAERTLYLPSFAICCLMAGIVSLPAWRGVLRRAGLATAVAILALFTVRTVTRVPDWKSTDAIMLALVRDRPDAFRGRWHLARMARVSGQVEASLARYAEAIELWPHRAGLVLEATAFAAEQGRRRLAYDWARLAAAQWPDDVGAQRMLAAAALDVGDLGTARAALAAGLRLDSADDVLNRMRAALDSTTTGDP